MRLLRHRLHVERIGRTLLRALLVVDARAVFVDVWIYNQALIRTGSNVCIWQRTFLTAGSLDRLRRRGL